MTGVGESAGVTAKALEVLRDLPLWLLVALACAANVLLFVPSVVTSAPSEWRPWVVVGSVLSTALAVVRAIALFVRWVPTWIAALNARHRFHVTPFPQQSFWSSTKQSDESVVTQIAARVLIRNRTEQPLSLVRSRLISPNIRGEILHGDVMIRAVGSNMYGTAVVSGHIVPPNASLPASMNLMIRGVPRRTPLESVNVKIGVIDDDGHEERFTMNMRVLSSKKPSDASAELQEAIFSISDPIEKEVAAVLQAELSRYDKCNRTVGGLGSVHIVYQGQVMTGVGNADAWDPRSPNNRAVVADPKEASLQSDNLDALLALYGRLSTTDEKQRFASSLLDRLDGTERYLRVSYFVVCCLWKTGRLMAALERSGAALPEGETKAFGLSNVMMMLNGLLRYRHADFTPEMLDAIEQFVHGMSEHPFQIRERIAAIRAARLLHKTP